MTADKWIAVLTACVPVLVAVVTIIPTIISNRKMTQESISSMKAEITKEVASLKGSFNDHVDEYEANKAKQARYRILRFYDEVCEGRRHSESHFEDVLDDIDFYETYCATHKDFKNNRGTAAMEHIKEIYRKVKAKGGFLTHEGE